jgi:hypothetical protein
MDRRRKLKCEIETEATAIAEPFAVFSICLEVSVKIDKRKKLGMPDLRHGLEGSVLVKDTNENFVGKFPDAVESGSGLISPDVGVPAAGQTTHE